jgi:hypothetical protein
MEIAELAGGLVTGLLFGAALGLIRPLVILILILTASSMVAVLLAAGVSGLLDILGRLAADIGRHAPFFASLAVGKLVGGALALR